MEEDLAETRAKIKEGIEEKRRTREQERREKEEMRRKEETEEEAPGERDTEIRGRLLL